MWTFKPESINEKKSTLRDILEEKYDRDYEINREELEVWRYVKGARKEYRIRKRDRELVGEEIWKLYQECMDSKNQNIWDSNSHLFEEILGQNGAYRYVEGAISFPDNLDSPARTIVTQEIGKTPDRMRHIIKLDSGIWRRLMPIELERLNMFPDNWTKVESIPASRQGFLMGNALVVGLSRDYESQLKELFKKQEISQ